MPAQAAETPARAVGRYQLDTAGCRLASAERAARGKAARARVPRDTHAVFDPPPDRLDPIALLEQQAASRVPELVPVRWGRMMVSPFSYYRGAALPMASDLAATPVSGLAVQACGDAHLSNFGLFGSAERRLMFDVNDFDETLPGPWEWDVKRLAASLEVAGRDNGFPAKSRREAVLATVSRYRQAMREFAAMTNLDVWYASVDANELRAQYDAELRARQRKVMDKSLAKARTRDSMQELEMTDGPGISTSGNCATGSSPSMSRAYARQVCRCTASCAAGPWPGRTPGRGIASPSPPTWVTQTSSTALSRSSRPPTPTRTSATTRPWSTRRSPGGSPPSTASDRRVT